MLSAFAQLSVLDEHDFLDIGGAIMAGRFCLGAGVTIPRLNMLIREDLFHVVVERDSIGLTLLFLSISLDF